MSSLDEELLMDAEEDARIVAHIQQVLPQELKEKFTEDDLYYFLDVLSEYYVHSGALDAQADDEGYVEIDEEKAAAYLEKTARKDKVGSLQPMTSSSLSTRHSPTIYPRTDRHQPPFLIPYIYREAWLLPLYNIPPYSFWLC